MLVEPFDPVEAVGSFAGDSPAVGYRGRGWYGSCSLKLDVECRGRWYNI